jgi:hypothetical protein
MASRYYCHDVSSLEHTSLSTEDIWPISHSLESGLIYSAALLTSLVMILVADRGTAYQISDSWYIVPHQDLQEVAQFIFLPLVVQISVSLSSCWLFSDSQGCFRESLQLCYFSGQDSQRRRWTAKFKRCSCLLRLSREEL